MFKFHLFKLILPALLISSSWAQADVSFSRVFVFGDSLSDTGNLASIVGDLPSPYFMNRISNGPVAVEKLAARLGLTAQASLHMIWPEEGSNYAIAGANASGIEPIDLTAQIIGFQANHATAPADALYVILIGGNDIRDARNETNPFIARSKVKAAAKKVRYAIKSLSRAGAHSFLLISAPNIGLIPDTRLIATATNDPELIERARKLSSLYQSELQKAARHLRYTSSINIIEFSLFDFFNDLVEQADQYGFSNTTDACFNSAESTFHPDCNFGSNFDQFIFFDEIHPTTRVHALVGDALYDEILNDTKEIWVGWYYLDKLKTLLYPSYTSF